MYPYHKKTGTSFPFFYGVHLSFHSFQKRRQVVAGLYETVFETVFVIDEMECTEGVLAETDDVCGGNQAVAPSVDDLDGIALAA